MTTTPPAVVYFQIAGAPGEYFQCQPMRATLSQRACAQMYAAEKSARAGSMHAHCRGCAVGALHAGERAPTPLFGALICPRCARGALRLVRGVCVSCINRQYEVVHNRNARGGAGPSLQLATLRMLLLEDDGGVLQARTGLSSGRLEVIWRALRTREKTRHFHVRSPHGTAHRILGGALFDPPVVQVV